MLAASAVAELTPTAHLVPAPGAMRALPPSASTLMLRDMQVSFCLFLLHGGADGCFRGCLFWLWLCPGAGRCCWPGRCRSWGIPVLLAALAFPTPAALKAAVFRNLGL